MNRYDIGETVRLQATCTNPDDSDAPFSPSTISLEIKDPAGDVTTVSAGFTNPSTGVYQHLLELTQSGVYHYRWATTGPAMAESGKFVVREKETS